MHGIHLNVFLISFSFAISINTFSKCCVGMRKENSQLQNKDMWKSAHQHSSVPGRHWDLCDVGIVTYKLDLSN
jgi:hypothetical protein